MTVLPGSVDPASEAPVVRSREVLSARGWFLKAVMGGSVLLIVGFWTAVAVVAAGILQ